MKQLLKILKVFCPRQMQKRAKKIEWLKILHFFMQFTSFAYVNKDSLVQTIFYYQKTGQVNNAHKIPLKVHEDFLA